MLTTAMICSAAVAGQFVGGKAVRDALYLAYLDVTTLPAMVIATSAVSILLVATTASIVAKLRPSQFVPTLFGASAVLLLVEWALTLVAPRTAVVLVYLHVSGFGPMLGSGFWLIASERFDPRTAKQRFGQIQGAGTFGGLIGALIAERVAAVFGIAAMLPVLAALNLLCAWKVRQLAGTSDGGDLDRLDLAPDLAPVAPMSGIRVLAHAPYLRNLAALVLLSTAGSTLLDYVFKAEAASALGPGEGLIRFFAIYYAATSVITFLLQTSLSRFALERFGLAAAGASPSLALLAGGAGALFTPGIAGITMARGGESVLRGSVFRAGYELFYTPIPRAEKRAAKSIIDVGFDRLGDAVGGGTVWIVLFLLPAAPSIPILSLAMACSAVAVLIASRLNHGYIKTLERSLLERAVELDLSEVVDDATRTIVMRTLKLPQIVVGSGDARTSRSVEAGEPTIARADDPERRDIDRLWSRDRDQVLTVLRREEPLTAPLVPLVIPLLAWDPAAADAVEALRRVAEDHVGQFVDVLIDQNQDFAIRRRLARVFSVCTSQRAADGLILGLEDSRFEVRFQSGRSLAAMRERNPAISIDRDRMLSVVLNEVAVGRPVWESRRLLDQPDAGETASFVDEFLRDRAGQSLAHVFTLLSLVLPREPLQIAFRGLYTEDRNLQGTALEYLEGILPAAIRERLWPFLEDTRAGSQSTRPRDEILADLLRSNESIMMTLDEMKRRAAAAQAAEGELPSPLSSVDSDG
jgi:ATP:ADP antiporter, AAA family